jgi:hypothetical protein
VLFFYIYHFWNEKAALGVEIISISEACARLVELAGVILLFVFRARQDDSKRQQFQKEFLSPASWVVKSRRGHFFSQEPYKIISNSHLVLCVTQRTKKEQQRHET